MLLPLLLVVGLTGIAARETDYCYAFEQDPYLLMGTKTAYQFVRGRSQLPPVPSEYTAFFFIGLRALWGDKVYCTHAYCGHIRRE